MQRIEHIRLENSHYTPVSTRSHWTQVKVQRCALAAMGALSTAGAATLVGLSLASIIVWPLALLSIPLLAGTLACYYFGSQLKDFEDPDERMQIRQEAFALSLLQLNEQYRSYGGIKTLWMHQILSTEELRYKFKQALVSITSFADFQNTFSIQTIALYTTLGLLTQEEASKLHELEQKAQNLFAWKKTQYHQLELRYPHRLDRELELLEKEKAQVIANYHRSLEHLRDAGYQISYIHSFYTDDPQKKKSAWKTYCLDRALTDLATTMLR
ncbi:MAG: hypothetical protein FJZ58_07620 [Chlamydiae bacterium]|nr:hypothetical protein [Chlamydiota bacterium]